jgi:hypothetical protein
MSKFKTMVFMIAAAVIMIALSSATANAQRPNPSADREARARSQGPCRDPWITLAIWDVSGATRQPAGAADFGECNYKLYNGGSWNNYDELYRAVDALQRSSLRITMTSLGGNERRIDHNAGDGYVWTQTIKFISDQGSALVGKTRMVSDNGAGLISQTKDFHLQSVQNAKVIKLGNTTVVIRK